MIRPFRPQIGGKRQLKKAGKPQQPHQHNMSVQHVIPAERPSQPES